MNKIAKTTMTNLLRMRLSDTLSKETILMRIATICMMKLNHMRV